jgi:hypothetical protein
MDHLQAALLALSQSWHGSGVLWNDSVRRDFEREYWDPLEAETRATQQAMAQLARVFAQARRDVK